jgi:hypothetical protein
MDSLVWWCCLQLTIIVYVVGQLSDRNASCPRCQQLYTVNSLGKSICSIVFTDVKPKKKSPSPIPHSPMKHLCFIIFGLNLGFNVGESGFVTGRWHKGLLTAATKRRPGGSLYMALSFSCGCWECINIVLLNKGSSMLDGKRNKIHSPTFFSISVIYV